MRAEIRQGNSLPERRTGRRELQIQIHAETRQKAKTTVIEQTKVCTPVSFPDRLVALIAINKFELDTSDLDDVAR